jgi:hypothetical protein
MTASCAGNAKVFRDALWRARPAQSSAVDRWSRAGTKIVLLVQAGARTVSQSPTPGFWWLVGDDRYMGLASEIGQHNRPGGAGVRGAAARRSLGRGRKQVEHTQDHEDPENDEANDEEFLLGVHGRPYSMKRCGRESQIGARVKAPAGRI